MPSRFAYVGDDPAVVSAAAAALERQAAASESIDGTLSRSLPRLRSAWTEGGAADLAYAAMSKVIDFTPTVAPSLRAVRSALDALARELTDQRAQVDRLNEAYREVAPRQDRVAGFGDWIPEQQEKDYQAALVDLQIASSRVGYRSVADIEAAYAAVGKSVERSAETCSEVITAQTRAQQPATGGRGSAFAASLAMTPSLGPTIDDLIARGLLPAEMRGMTSTQVLAYLADHPEVSRRLMANRPDAFAPGVEGFLASIGQPTVSAPGTDLAALQRDRVRAFLEQLSPEDQRLVGALFPAQVGGLGGAPFIARYAANRVAIVVAASEQGDVITGIKAKLAQFDVLARDPRVGGVDVARSALRAQLAEAEGTMALYQGVLADPNRQIVLFDRDRGAFAEVSGSIGPQTRNIGVMVPGTTTNLGGIAGNVQNYSTFVTASNGDLAMITWMGGPLPQSIPDAISASYSRDLGPRLAAFSHDVRQEGGFAGAASPPRLTVAGHSYGGAVVGIAETYGCDADRIMHIESPGMGNDVSSIADYHPANPAVRRYSMTAPGDLIALAHDVDLGSVGHGPNPDHMQGVTLLDTGRYPDGTLIEGSSSHGGVFRRYSDAWRNMYEVFTGGTVTVRQPDVTVNLSAPPITVRSSDPPTSEDIP